jgi:integrase
LFLSHLASQGKVSASTQRQAMNAIVFLYAQVLDLSIQGRIEPVRARRHPRLTVVMTQEEVQRVLSEIKGTHLLMARLMYGAGLRLMECVRLRVQDLDFERSLVYVRAAKGNKDRVTLLPAAVHQDVNRHVKRVKTHHQEDLSRGLGAVYVRKPS